MRAAGGEGGEKDPQNRAQEGDREGYCDDQDEPEDRPCPVRHC